MEPDKKYSKVKIHVSLTDGEGGLEFNCEGVKVPALKDLHGYIAELVRKRLMGVSDEDALTAAQTELAALKKKLAELEGFKKASK